MATRGYDEQKARFPTAPHRHHALTQLYQKKTTTTPPPHNKTHLYLKRKMRQKNPRLFLLFTTFPSLCLFTCHFWFFQCPRSTGSNKIFHCRLHLQGKLDLVLLSKKSSPSFNTKIFIKLMSYLMGCFTSYLGVTVE